MNWLACGLWFLFGAFLGIEASGYSFHQQDPKPAFVKIPQRVEPVDVLRGFDCKEAARTAWQQCRMARQRG